MKKILLSIILTFTSFISFASEIYKVDINQIDLNNVGTLIPRFDTTCTITSCDNTSNHSSDVYIDYEQIQSLTKLQYKPVIIDSGLFLIDKHDFSINNGFLYLNVLGSIPHESKGYANTAFLTSVSEKFYIQNKFKHISEIYWDGEINYGQLSSHEIPEIPDFEITVLIMIDGVLTEMSLIEYINLWEITRPWMG